MIGPVPTATVNDHPFFLSFFFLSSSSSAASSSSLPITISPWVALRPASSDRPNLTGPAPMPVGAIARGPGPARRRACRQARTNAGPKRLLLQRRATRRPSFFPHWPPLAAGLSQSMPSRCSVRSWEEQPNVAPLLSLSLTFPEDAVLLARGGHWAMPGMARPRPTIPKKKNWPCSVRPENFFLRPAWPAVHFGPGRAEARYNSGHSRHSSTLGQRGSRGAMKGPRESQGPTGGVEEQTGEGRRGSQRPTREGGSRGANGGGPEGQPRSDGGIEGEPGADEGSRGDNGGGPEGEPGVDGGAEGEPEAYGGRGRAGEPMGEY